MSKLVGTRHVVAMPPNLPHPVAELSGAIGKLFTGVCLYHQPVQNGTGQWAVMLFDWEGNRTSRVAVSLLLRH